MLACHNHAALVTRLSDPATRRRIVLAWSGANEPVFTVYPIAFAATLASPGSFYTVHPGHNDRGHAIWLFNMPVEQSLLPPLELFDLTMDVVHLLPVEVAALFLETCIELEPDLLQRQKILYDQLCIDTAHHQANKMPDSATLFLMRTKPHLFDLFLQCHVLIDDLGMALGKSRVLAFVHAVLVRWHCWLGLDSSDRSLLASFIQQFCCKTTWSWTASEICILNHFCIKHEIYMFHLADLKLANPAEVAVSRLPCFLRGSAHPRSQWRMATMVLRLPRPTVRVHIAQCDLLLLLCLLLGSADGLDLLSHCPTIPSIVRAIAVHPVFSATLSRELAERCAAVQVTEVPVAPPKTVKRGARARAVEQ